MFIYLTNVILDITVGITWWITKHTCYTVYNGVTYILSNSYNYYSGNETSTSENNSEDNINNSIVIIESEELFDKIRSLSKNEKILKSLSIKENL